MATEIEDSQARLLSIETNEGRESCQTTFILEGMMCASCAMHVEKGWKKVPGVNVVDPPGPMLLVVPVAREAGAVRSITRT